MESGEEAGCVELGRAQPQVALAAGVRVVEVDVGDAVAMGRDEGGRIVAVLDRVPRVEGDAQLREELHQPREMPRASDRLSRRPAPAGHVLDREDRIAVVRQPVESVDEPVEHRVVILVALHDAGVDRHHLASEVRGDLDGPQRPVQRDAREVVPAAGEGHADERAVHDRPPAADHAFERRELAA